MMPTTGKWCERNMCGDVRSMSDLGTKQTVNHSSSNNNLL